MVYVLLRQCLSSRLRKRQTPSPSPKHTPGWSLYFLPLTPCWVVNPRKPIECLEICSSRRYTNMSQEFEVTGNNKAALFTMKLHRGDGMSLIAMNWKQGKPPKDFVGFAIEYKQPNDDKFYALKN